MNNNFFNRSVRGHHLGLARMLFFASLLFYYYDWNFAQWVGPFNESWQPVSFFNYLPQPTSTSTFQLLEKVWSTGLLLCCIGLFSRFSLPLTAILSLLLMGLPNNFGKINNAETLPMLVVIILSFSHCGRCFSIDAWLANRRKKPFNSYSPEYSWPFSAIQFTMVLIYFAAGIQKLRHIGLDWVFSNHIQTIFLNAGTLWGARIAEHPLLCQILAACVVICELHAPLALFLPKTRVPLMGGLFLFHFCSTYILGQGGAFTPYLFCYVFWIPNLKRNV